MPTIARAPLWAASLLALALAAPVLAQDATTDATADANADGTAAPAEQPAAPAEAGSEAATMDDAAADAPADAATSLGDAASGATDALGDAATGATDAAPAAALEVPTRDTVVATVNGTDITFGEVAATAATLPPQYRQLPPEVLLPSLVDQLVQQELLAQTVTTPSPTVELQVENERRMLLASEAAQGIATAAVTPEALQAAYDAAYANAEPQTEWNASHILVATEDEAKAVEARLAAGEDFATVAQEVSTDTGSGAQGGELGWFGPGMMVPEFQAAVEALEPGQVSPPVQSQFGWHVVRLNEERPLAPPTLEEVRAELEGPIQQEAVLGRIEALEAEGAVTRADLATLDAAALNDPALLGE